EAAQDATGERAGAQEARVAAYRNVDRFTPDVVETRTTWVRLDSPPFHVGPSAVRTSPRTTAMPGGPEGVQLFQEPPIQVKFAARAGVTLMPIATNIAKARARLMVAPPAVHASVWHSYFRRSLRLRSTPLDTVLKTNSICGISATVAGPVN